MHYRDAQLTPVLTHLELLEAEAIHALREAAASFRRPALLFSGGKDSITLTRLAEKAFRPARFPFPLLHVDTGHNFPETIAYRDALAKRLGERLVIASVQDAIDAGLAQEDPGPPPSRNRAQSPTLLEAVREHGFDCLIGGARRDEEKARAKERFFSVRDDFGQWDPRNQRPEPWDLYNAHLRPGEHMRVFPLSNWTELDVWQYVKQKGIELPELYFAHDRDVIERKGALLPVSQWLQPPPGEPAVTRSVRFRTLGDATCTAAVASEARTLDDVVAEIAAARISERGVRLDDQFSDSAMEDRKKEGYF
ncbi:MAG: sulfate adenylyltransferase subunit CysD [Phycisphaerae bacterium]